MPRLKTATCTVRGVEFKAHLNVSTAGEFSITRSGTSEDWPHHSMKITGTTAAQVEAEWRQAVHEFSARNRAERKVIVVRFDSLLRVNGLKNSFTGRDTMLVLEAGIALETTTTQGGATTKAYREHPDYCGMHTPRQPFPCQMVLSHGDYNHLHEDVCIVEWTQEVEDTITRACKGIQAIVDMLDEVTSSPEKLMLAASQIALLPAPQTKPDHE